MQFHLNFQPKGTQNQITHQDEILFMGSCFSEHIASRMSELKFHVNTNPFGIVFNPKSMLLNLNRMLYKDYFTVNDVFEKDRIWYSFDAHSSLYASSQFELLKRLNDLIDQWHEKIQVSSFLMLTFGSAYAYYHKQKQKVVANCHKLPQIIFDKNLLNYYEIVSEFQLFIDELKRLNPKLKIVFTVSPVKHLRDGVIENNLSKAILIQSVHQLVQQNERCLYFPAYELVADDLRDYRFYEADMAHPNLQAINYVWSKFSEVYFNEITQQMNTKLSQIHQAYLHRIMNQSSENAMKFKESFYQKCVSLKEEFPFLNLEEELTYFQTRTN